MAKDGQKAEVLKSTIGRADSGHRTIQSLLVKKDLNGSALDFGGKIIDSRVKSFQVFQQPLLHSGTVL